MPERRLKFPFAIGDEGRPSRPASLADHVRDEVIQLLLTDPGERLFQPDFGAGLKRLVFEANDDVTAALAKARIVKALNHWLGTRIEVLQVEAEAEDGVLTVETVYRLRATGETQRIAFQHRDDLLARTGEG